MNSINSTIFEKANEAAVYNVYLYLSDKDIATDNRTFGEIVVGLEEALNISPDTWSDRDKYRLRIIRNSIIRDPLLTDSVIGNITRSSGGALSCTFTNARGEVFLVFSGTGDGEWIDNGEGLSGISEENTYISYGIGGTEESRKTVMIDHATDSQTEALNMFNSIASENGWDEDTKIIVSGHSKGGNKAQFITAHSDLVDMCFSFDGQGFSPEALAALENLFGNAFLQRKRKIYSFSSENDYVNVLGDRLVPEDQVYYFESYNGFHHMEAILDEYGRFRLQCGQGSLSRYIETVSSRLMRMDPYFRKFVTLGMMNIAREYLGDGDSIEAKEVSIEETVAGIGIALAVLIRSLW